MFGKVFDVGADMSRAAAADRVTLYGSAVARASELLGLRRLAVRWAVPAEEAACTSADVDMLGAFFSCDPADVARAQAVCALCPVQLQCLAGALARDEQWGVWGGWAFEPRTVQADTHPASSDSPAAQDGPDGGKCHRGRRRPRTGWEVWTTDVHGVSQFRGFYRSTTVAVAAAERWVEDDRWRAELGCRFARVLDAVAADAVDDGKRAHEAVVGEAELVVPIARDGHRPMTRADRSQDAA